MNNNKRKKLKEELEIQSGESLKRLSNEEKKQIYKKEVLPNIILSAFCVVFLGAIGLFCLLYDTNYRSVYYISLVGGILSVLGAVGFIVFLIFELKKSKDIIVVRYLKKGIRPLIQETLNINAISFSATKILKTPDSIGLPKTFIFDENTKCFILKKGLKYSDVYNFSDVLSCELYEKSYQQLESTAGAAAIGGLLFGNTGAIIGSSVSRKIEDINSGLSVLICLNNEEKPLIIIDYIRIGASYDTTSLSYMQKKMSAQLFCVEFLQIVKKGDKEGPNSNIKNTVPSNNFNKEQLQELKEMLDDGLITQEDFEQKKKQILGL